MQPKLITTTLKLFTSLKGQKILVRGIQKMNYSRLSFLLALLIGIVLLPGIIYAQTVTGAFDGRVTDRRTETEIPGAQINIRNINTNETYDLVSDSQGRFYQAVLEPGIYRITVASPPKYQSVEIEREVSISRPGEVVPVPVELDQVPAGAAPAPPILDVSNANDIRLEINTTDARRDGTFKEKELTTLPIGSTTITRTFDELALLLPGVAPAPQTIGDIAGPGVGPGVGSAGQFSVNGLRSRGNNFTVDGSDNNDEDIGVRRQGFVALNSQPIESVQEYQVITLLAPAQFGRNIGAQVNAVSKRGRNNLNGTLYGYLNSHVLNARNYFDTTNASSDPFGLRTASGQPVLLDENLFPISNQSGGEDSFTAGQGGGTLGGAIIENKLFYFLSGEYQKINAAREKSFAVPTVEQRGIFGMGATGVYQNFLLPNIDSSLQLCDVPRPPGTPFNSRRFQTCNTSPSTLDGSAIFSLFPFPNNENGVFGANTFTQVLPASGRGVVLSGRLDNNFRLGGKQQSVAGRYNFTDDERNIPSVNEAIFSTVLSKVRTHNLSLYYNSELNNSSTGNRLFNQIRFSFGRTRLNFEEVRDAEFLTDSSFANGEFLLNAPLRQNNTFPTAPGQANTTSVNYCTVITPTCPISNFVTVENALTGPVGQVVVAGYSPLGADVYNFPQKRTNNTLQFADELTWRQDGHNYVFGADIRRTDLISDLPRLSRPLLTFNGVPRLTFVSGTNLPAGSNLQSVCQNGGIQNGSNYYCYPTRDSFYPIITPTDLVAFGVPSNSLLTFIPNVNATKADLRFYQYNFYAQDTWRIKYNLSLSYGLRYEYNSPVHEVNGLIESNFSDGSNRQLISDLAPGLMPFIEGRTSLYKPDRNNLAPRFGIAYSPSLFGNLTSVFRAGYGIFYDQILGAVVNQSRYVFPTFLTVNVGGLALGENGAPQPTGINSPVHYSQNGTNVTNEDVRSLINRIIGVYPNAINATLPSQKLEMPMAHHYDFIFEQKLSRNLAFSIGYIGTTGENLLRFLTPNNGSSLTNIPLQVLTGTTAAPSSRVALQARGISLSPNRPTSFGGQSNSVNIFATNASSNYNSLQTQLRGRFLPSFDFQVSYTYSKVTDDVSDVFDLAGAYALPQNSFDLAAERGPANFDVRHRWSYNLIYDLTGMGEGSPFLQLLTKNLQISSTGRFHTGQPFTVNSIIDVNLDGNLTDRLNTTEGIEITNDRSQPLRLTTNNTIALLAPFGESGRVGRNTFRAGNVLDLDLSVLKRFSLSNDQGLTFRADIFNFINRSNFGIPVRLLEAPGFGRATNTVTPGRRIQFALKYDF